MSDTACVYATSVATALKVNPAVAVNVIHEGEAVAVDQADAHRGRATTFYVLSGSTVSGQRVKFHVTASDTVTVAPGGDHRAVPMPVPGADEFEWDCPCSAFGTGYATLTDAQRTADLHSALVGV